MLLTCRPDAPMGDITDLQWRYSDGRVIPNVNSVNERPPVYAEDMPGGTLALIISNLKAGDEGNYSCTATFAKTEKLVEYVVINTIMPITWQDAPLEQHPIAHTDYRIKCQVIARPSPIVDWLKEGEPLPLNQNPRYQAEAEGLLIRNITSADDGTYTCRAIVMDTGELGERAISVVVHTPPTMSEDMKTAVEAVEGQTANLECQATGKPLPQYQWVRLPTQEDLSSAGRFSVDALKGILTITSVERNDQGEYSCIAFNEAGRRERKVTLEVVVLPRIEPIKNISSPEDMDVQLKCIARGRPMPLVTFRKLSNEKPYIIGSQPGEDRITMDNQPDEENDAMVGLLIIDKVIRSDDGLYECIATNKGGTARANGHITVEFKPSFANTPISEAWTWNHHPINITCLAESIPNATITWTQRGRNITDDPRFVQITKGAESTLLLTNPDASYYGDYKCTAINKHGIADHVIHVKEASVPSMVLQAKMDVVTATTIKFSFIGPKDLGGLPIKAYAVQYKEERQSWDEAKNKTWVIDSAYILENLLPQTKYMFRFAAQNDVGFGPWSAEESRLMPKRSTPEEPRILNMVHDGIAVSPYATHFELRWQTPADNGERIDEYEIKYCVAKLVENKWKEMQPCQERKIRADDHSTSYKLQALLPDTHYKVELRAHNSIGFSSPGQVIMKTVPGAGLPAERAEDPVLSSAAIVIIVVASLFVLLIIIDLLCFCFNKSGIIMAICEKTRSKPDDTDIKLGREEKEPLRHERPLVPIIRSVKRETSVDFDMKKSISRTSFVGKDSAV
ncbi:fasciclin-2 isoform X2 [Anabrus simplex]|uniref:fasciclin-2 isoform X2 n=1 Tax=Anabrus simplex TaxID=316456 RepID=UPI0034DD821A